MQAFLLLLAEWAVNKYGHQLFVSIRDWIKKSIENSKSKEILKSNQEALASAIKSGDQNAINKASENALNNTNNP